MTEVLTPVEAQLVRAVAMNPQATQEQLAAILRRSPRTVRRLLARDAVKAALDEGARDAVRAATNVLAHAATRVAGILVSMATGKVKAAPARVAACVAVLREGRELIDLGELADRVAAFERDRSVFGGLPS